MPLDIDICYYCRRPGQTTKLVVGMHWGTWVFETGRIGSAMVPNIACSPLPSFASLTLDRGRCTAGQHRSCFAVKPAVLVAWCSVMFRWESLPPWINWRLVLEFITPHIRGVHRGRHLCQILRCEGVLRFTIVAPLSSALSRVTLMGITLRASAGSIIHWEWARNDRLCQWRLSHIRQRYDRRLNVSGETSRAIPRGLGSRKGRSLDIDIRVWSNVSSISIGLIHGGYMPESFTRVRRTC
jgi:hypothetical protein